MVEYSFWLHDIILESVSGSHLFGTNVESSDVDKVGIAIESPSYILGLRRFEAAEVEKSVHHSGTDRTIHGLRAYIQKVAKGNPSLLELLYAPKEMLITDSEIAEKLRGIRSEFTTQSTIKNFLGYLTAQAERFKKSMNGEVAPGRSDLVAKYGRDTKFMAHAVRLGYEGLELATKGTITLPLPKLQREHLLEIRNNKMSNEDFFQSIALLRNELEKALPSLPKKSDFNKLDLFLIEIYKEYWGW